MIRTVAVTGPESTGKSWLTAALAARFDAPWVPEYAREYLEKLNRPYEESDILAIARGQLAAEKMAASQAGRWLFCDTELLVTKIWSEVKFGRCHPWIVNQLKSCRYGLYLLCDIDLPWQYDPLREHPGRRKFLFDLYLNELTARRWPFAVIRGSGDERLEHAVRGLEGYFGDVRK